MLRSWLHQQENQEEREPASQSDLQNYQLTRDRTRRQIRVPSRYAQAEIVSYALSVASEVVNSEPLSYKEAVSRSDKSNWKKAMDEEMESLRKNETWILVPKPVQQRLVGCKWIYKIKEGIPGVESKRYKAWLVAKGFT